MSYLENTWYCIGWDEELEQGPIGRTVIEKNIVVFKTEQGELVALGGVCPHRFAPLAEGKVCENTIACPYHGLVFDSSGHCIRNPHGPGGEGPIPPNAKVPKYVALEKYGTIWVWLGDPELADASLLNLSDWRSSPDYGVVTGHLEVPANYELIIDNLLDPTHAPYIHAGTIAPAAEDTSERSEGGEFERKINSDQSIQVNSFFENVANLPPFMRGVAGDDPADLRSETRWCAPSLCEVGIFVSPVGADKLAGFHQPSYHFVTPKNSHESYYFFASGRNVEIDSKEMDEFFRKFLLKAFADEDVPMIEACQGLMGTYDLMSLRPAILESDFAPVQARRALAKLIREENSVAD